MPLSSVATPVALRLPDTAASPCMARSRVITVLPTVAAFGSFWFNCYSRDTLSLFWDAPSRVTCHGKHMASTLHKLVSLLQNHGEDVMRVSQDTDCPLP